MRCGYVCVYVLTSANQGTTNQEPCVRILCPMASVHYGGCTVSIIIVVVVLLFHNRCCCWFGFALLLLMHVFLTHFLLCSHLSNCFVIGRITSILTQGTVLLLLLLLLFMVCLFIAIYITLMFGDYSFQFVVVYCLLLDSFYSILT